MKIEIEKSEYDRLKSREEKLMAYYGWFVDKENDLVTVEDVVNKNIELEKENKKLNENIKWYEKEEDRLREEIRFLEECLDNKEKVNKQLREEIQEWLNAIRNK